MPQSRTTQRIAVRILLGFPLEPLLRHISGDTRLTSMSGQGGPLLRTVSGFLDNPYAWHRYRCGGLPIHVQTFASLGSVVWRILAQHLLGRGARARVRIDAGARNVCPQLITLLYWKTGSAIGLRQQKVRAPLRFHLGDTE